MGDKVMRVGAVLLCAALISQACASSGGTIGRPVQAPKPGDQAVLADYVQRLPPGTAVRVSRLRGPALRGTLMRATSESLILQPRTRLAEPPIELPLSGIAAVTPESGGPGLGTAIAAGAVAGATTALAVIFILIAAFN